MLNRIGQWFDGRRRRSALRKAIARLKKQDDLAEVPKSVFEDLIYGWGDGDNPPTPFFLHVMVSEAQRSDGSILMCGAGLTTLVLGIQAQKFDTKLWVLESNTTWFRRMKELLKEHRIDNVQMVYAPLCDYKSFSWYSIDRSDYPRDFSLVICDGPRRGSPGGRVGLYNVMYEYLSPKSLTLMNDVSDDESQNSLQIWKDNLKVEVRETNQDRSFVYVLFDKSRVVEAATEETCAPDSDRSVYL